MAVTDMRIVARSLWSRRFATATTVLVVAVAVALLLVLLGLRNAGQRAFARGTGNMHLLVSGDVSPLNSVLNAVFYMGIPARADKLSRFDALIADRRIAWAIPVVQGDNYKGFPTLATTPAFFTDFKPAPDTAWTFALGGPFKTTFDVVLGSQAAAGTGLRIGDSLNIVHGAADVADRAHTDFDFKVSGILNETGTAHDRAVFITTDSTWVVHAHDKRKAAKDPQPAAADNLRDAEKLITGLYIRVRGRSDSDTPPTLPQVYEELRRDRTLTVAQPGDQVRRLFEIVSGVDRIIVAIAAAVLASSVITVMLVLYQAMQLRRRQVAVLRALGATQGRVFMLALTEAAIIGLCAAALGVLLALAGSTVVAWAVHARFGLRITSEVDPRTLFAVCAGTVALACLAGIVPAASAYRTDVLRNLRPIG